MGEVRRPHGGGWGEHGGSSPENFTRELPHPWGKVHSYLMPTPPQVGGGGVIDRCIKVGALNLFFTKGIVNHCFS